MLCSQPLEVPFAWIELSSLLLSLPSTEHECKLVTPVTSDVCMNFNMSRDYPVSGTKYKIQFDNLFVSQITIIYWFRVLSGAVRWQSIGLPWLFPVIVHRKFHWDCPLDWLSGQTVTGFVIGQSPEISTNFQHWKLVFSRVDSDGCPAGVHRKMWGSVKTSDWVSMGIDRLRTACLFPWVSRSV